MLDKKKKLAFLIIAITLIVYLYPVLKCGFIWDTKLQMNYNSIIKGEKPLYKAFFTNYWGELGGKINIGYYYRPFVIITMGIEKRIFGEKNKYLFHLFNLFIFLLSLFLVFRVLLLYIDEYQAFFTTLLFALHPLNSDNVFWIVGLSDLYSILSFFSALFFAKKFIEEEKKINLIFFSFFVFIGLFSKETFTVYILGLIVLLFFESIKDKRTAQKLVYPSAITIVLIIYFFILKNYAISPKKSSSIFIFPYNSIVHFIETVIKTTGFYFKAILLPFNYKMFISNNYLKLNHLIWGIAFLIFSLLIFIFKDNLLKNAKSFALTLYTIGFSSLVLLVVKVFPFSISTRYIYFSIIPLSLIFVKSILKLRFHKIIIISILLLFSFQLFITGTYYENELNFWKKTYSDMQENSFTITMYANSLYRTQNYYLAEKLFKKALKYKISNPAIAFTIAMRLYELSLLKGKYDEALHWLNSIKEIVEYNKEMKKIWKEKFNYLKKKIQSETVK